MSATPRPKIAYYSINNPLDKRSWSGTTYYLGQSLQQNIGDIHFLGPVKIPWILDKAMRGIAKTTRLLFKSEWIPKYSLLKNIYAMIVLKKKMKGHNYDFLVAPAAASELAYLKTDLPIIYFGDATYKVYSETYAKEFKNLNSFSRWEGNHLELKALRKSSLVVLTSQWAAKSAIQDYGTSPDKIVVMPLGANIDLVPDRSLIYRKEENKTLTLLFLAVDWDRKGGPISFATMKELHAAGVPARLIVCGCVPPPQFNDPCMEVIPFLNKNEPGDYEKFVNLLSSVHFLILPTQADCSLLVACESNAYGVPALTTNVGGVSDIVKDGVNGFCLPPEAGGTDFASLIIKIFSDKEKYHQLIHSSRELFEQKLNWNKWAEQFQQVLKNRKFV
jgi:glycosyltransferase involved in cell wall biosynthesis